MPDEMSHHELHTLSVSLRDFVKQWQSSHAEMHLIERQEREAKAAVLQARLDAKNDVFDQLRDERGTYISRSEIALMLQRREEMDEIANARFQRIETRQARQDGQTMILGALALTTLSGIAAVIVKLIVGQAVDGWWQAAQVVMIAVLALVWIRGKRD